MQSPAIVLLSVAAAVLYGVVHDQITVRVCVEYFTIGHPPVFATDNPTWLGLGWGVIATWWAGMLVGIPLACAARVGPLPSRTWHSLVRPAGFVLLAMGVCALAAGIAGWVLADSGAVALSEPMTELVPVSRHSLFIADLWAHSASYFVGFEGGIVVIGVVLRSRYLEWKLTRPTTIRFV